MAIGSYGSSNRNWKGGRKNANGYIKIYIPEHPKSDQGGYVYEHTLIAEKALGKTLPPKAVVHHANGSRDSGPLVICEDIAYHHLLHQRMRALQACGHANWQSCGYCLQYDNPKNMFINKTNCYHPSCHREYQNNYNRAKRLNQEGCNQI